ncbi:hypothetical protein SAMN05443254_11794 [Bradyrhizobium sp. OK095]|nr:hypothetical protein SAMN05443254_11794 [Bradyrhizobium sp. OK095]
MSGGGPPSARYGGVLELIEVAVLLLRHAGYDRGPAQA